MKQLKFMYYPIFLLMIVGACSVKTKNEISEQALLSSDSQATQAATAIKRIYVSNEKNVSIADIEIGESVIIQLGDRVIFEKMGSSGNMKYVEDNGTFWAKVKGDENGLKLKSEGGNLLWKVKITESKIKVAASEEMTDPMEIKEKDAGIVKVYLMEEEVAKISQKDPYKVTIKSVDKYLVMGSSAMQAGIIALDDLKLEERLIILAELARR